MKTTVRCAFAACHPIVNLVYFLLVLGFAAWFRNPVCIGISLLVSTGYACMLTGVRNLHLILKGLLPMSILMIGLNPVFNHQGITILGYFPGGNPFTLESLLYGFAATAILWSLIQWFVCWNQIMTTEKLLYLFGRIAPALSLVLSMSLQLVSRYTRQLKKIMAAQRQFLDCTKQNRLGARLRMGVRVLSALTSWAIEHGVETVQSMKGRGYGLPGRTAFSIYTWQKRDGFMLAGLLAAGGLVWGGSAAGVFHFAWFPAVTVLELQWPQILLYSVYALLAIWPMILECKEEVAWRKSFGWNN